MTMPGSILESLGRATERSSSMQISTIASSLNAPFESIRLHSDCECVEQTTAVSGSFARGIRWALGLEFGAALCVYGLWCLCHLR